MKITLRDALKKFALACIGISINPLHFVGKKDLYNPISVYFPKQRMTYVQRSVLVARNHSGEIIQAHMVIDLVFDDGRKYPAERHKEMAESFKKEGWAVAYEPPIDRVYYDHVRSAYQLKRNGRMFS